MEEMLLAQDPETEMVRHQTPGTGTPGNRVAPTRNRSKSVCAGNQWSPEEDQLLAQSVSELCDDWAAIAARFPNRSTKQVLAHWKKVADPSIVRGSWTEAEDMQIIAWVTKFGACKWATLANSMPGRIAKQCRERWVNHLDPNLKHGDWSRDEDVIIITMIQKIGHRWADIAKVLQGRSDNQVKNRWNSTLKRKMNTLFSPDATLSPEDADLSDHLRTVLEAVDAATAANTLVTSMDPKGNQTIQLDIPFFGQSQEVTTTSTDAQEIVSSVEVKQDDGNDQKGQ